MSASVTDDRFYLLSSRYKGNCSLQKLITVVVSQNIIKDTNPLVFNGYWYFAERNGTKFGATSGKLKKIIYMNL